MLGRLRVRLRSSGGADRAIAVAGVAGRHHVGRRTARQPTGKEAVPASFPTSSVDAGPGDGP